MASRIFMGFAWILLVGLAWTANLWPTELPTEPHARASLLSANGFSWQLSYGPQMATSGPVDPKQLYAWIDRDAEQGHMSVPLRRRLNTLAAHPDTAVLARIARSYALCQVEGEPLKAYRELANLPDELPMVLSTRALALTRLGREEEALKVWRQAMNSSLSLREWNGCANFCAEYRHLEDLARLVNVAGSRIDSRREKIWLAKYSGSYLEALKLELLYMRDLSGWAWLASFLTALLWLGILRGRTWFVRFLGYSSGVVSILLLHNALDSLMWKLSLTEIRTSHSLSFWRCFMEAGVLEELTKLAPLLFWWRMGQLRQPGDWVLFGCLSALGFATVENLSYYDWSVNAFLGRFLLCVPGHMALTAAVAYTLARSSRRRVLVGLTAFLMAACYHAAYNYFQGSKPFLAMLQSIWLVWLLWGNLRTRSLEWLGGIAILLQSLSFWQIHANVATDIANAQLLLNAGYLVALPAFFCFLKSPQNWGIERWMVFVSVACYYVPYLFVFTGYAIVGYLIYCYFFLQMALSARNFALWPNLPTQSPVPEDLKESGFRSVSVTAQGSDAQHQHYRRIAWLRWTLAMTLAQSMWLPELVGRAPAAEFSWAYCQALGMTLAFNFCLIWPATLLSPTLIGAWSNSGGISLLAFRGLGGRPSVIAYSASPPVYLATANFRLAWSFNLTSLASTLICRWSRSVLYGEIVREHQEFLATLEEGVVDPEGHDPETYLSLMRHRACESWLTFWQHLFAPFLKSVPVR